jgi:CRISPR system Cascade subunit CasB
MNPKFERGKPLGEVLLKWWQGLDDNRGDRAVLRRASNVTGIAVSAPYQRLYRRLLATGALGDLSGWQRESLSAVAGLLAHIKEDDAGAVLPKSLSHRAEGSDRPAVSELRFVRLLESPDLDALFGGLRRALPLMGHKVDVVALANDVIGWGDAVKKRWAYGYEWPEKTGA